MKMNKCFSGLLVALLLSMTACSDSDETPDGELQKGIAIKSIEATSDVDLSARSGWLFRVGYSNPDCVYYNYSADGNKLHASSADEENMYHFDKRWEEGHVLGMAGRLVCYFQDKRYFRSTNVRSMSPERPDILDQSTEERFLIADRLEGIYTGAVRSDISGLELVHANMLVEFKIEGIDANAEVRALSGGFPVVPLQTGDNSYKAIIDRSPSISVKVGDDVGHMEVASGFNGNVRYTVKAHWDAGTKTLIADDIKEEEWK